MDVAASPPGQPRRLRESILRRCRRVLVTHGAIVFLAALGFRALYLLESAESPAFRLPILDALTYDLLARSLARGDALTGAFFWQPTFYPAFLAAVYRICGTSIVLVKILQAVLGAVTCVLTYRLGRKLFGAGAGLAAGLMAALYGPLIFYDGELLATGWAAFLSVALLLLLLRTAETGGAIPAGLLGLCAALGILTRPEFLPFLAAAAVWLAWRLRAGPRVRRPRPRVAVALLVGFALPAVPMALASHRATGRFAMLPASGGTNLYIGNNPDSEETVNARPGSAWSEIMDLPQRRGVFSPALGEREAVYNREVREYARHRPLEFAAGLRRKAVQLVTSREIPRNEDLYLFRRWSAVLRLLTWKLGPFGFPFGVVLPLAAVTLLLQPRRIPAVVWLYFGLYGLSIVAVFVTGRYRAPMIPVILPLAAAGGAAIVEWIRMQSWRRLASAAACALAALLLATLPGPFAAERMDYEPELYDDLGRALGRYGRFPEAVEHLRRAVALDPGYADGHANLAYMLERAGRSREAIEEYRIALGQNPKMVHAHDGLGRLLAAEGQPEEAISLYRRALELRPYDTTVRARLAELLLSLERSDEAMVECERALRYDPEHALALYLLGVERAKRRDWAAAEEALLRAAASAPHGPRLVSQGDVYCALARSARARGAREQAVAWYNDAIIAYRRELDADPGNRSLKSSMGAALAERQGYQER